MTAFIIDTYNKYDSFDRSCSRYIFEINGTTYAIKEVQLKWGKPKLPLRIGDTRDQEPYHIYETYEDALKFARTIKSIN